MKRLRYFSSALLITLTFFGCGGTEVGNPGTTPSQPVQDVQVNFTPPSASNSVVLQVSATGVADSGIYRASDPAAIHIQDFEFPISFGNVSNITNCSSDSNSYIVFNQSTQSVVSVQSYVSLQITCDVTLGGTTERDLVTVDLNETTSSVPTLLAVKAITSQGTFQQNLSYSSKYGSFWVGICPGDTNGDGRVDDTDKNLLVANYGKTAPPGTFLLGDVNGDGKVDFADLLLFAQNYGKVCNPN